MTEANDPKAMPFLVDAGDAARGILRGIERRRRVVHFPWVLAYFVNYVLHTMPDSLYEWLATEGTQTRALLREVTPTRARRTS
jgi:hypothetical protein